MKTAFFFLLLLWCGVGVAQSDITPSISGALASGDVAQLSSFFMSPIDITVLDTDGSMSREEARDVCAQFFAQATVKSFTIKHQGTSKLDDQYRIGELITSKGVYRVTFFIRKSGNAMLIKQLKIEAGGV
jgi:Domain of unknown function (DUF4783)